MMFLPIVAEKPNFTAITLEEARKQLDVYGFDDDDNQIEGLIKAASEHMQRLLNMTLCRSKLIQSFSCFAPLQQLGTTPVSEVTSVAYYDNNNNLQILDKSEYSLYATANGYFVSLPKPQETYKQRLDTLEIEFYAGYNEGEVPENLKVALLMHVAALYENRGDFSQSKTPSFDAYNALIWPFRKLSV